MKSGLESLLPSVPGVRKASANHVTGTVLIVFSTDLDLQKILDAVEAMLRDLELDQMSVTARIHGSKGHAEPMLPAGSTGTSETDSNAWHVLGPEETLTAMRTGRDGLTRKEAAERFRRIGANILAQGRQRSELAMFFGQFKSLPVALLGGAAVLSIATGGLADAAVIGAVVLINALFGFHTERQVERTIHSLEEGPERHATVLRGGRPVKLDVSGIVPGDVLILRRGDVVPADARLLQVEHLSVDESALTGESVNVTKTAEMVADRSVALGDRVNMVYRGTVVTGGAALAVVVATGGETEIGRIQRLIGESQAPETPMQRQLREVGGKLVAISVLACGGVFVAGLLRGHSLLEMLRTSISLAIAAIPEGLPAVATMTLARGVRRLESRGVLVRQLHAIETLASVHTICLDKTGTLTVNEQTVAEIVTASGGIRIGSDQPADLASPEVRRLLEIAVLCNETKVIPTEERGVILDGSSTEKALVQAALEAGVDALALRELFPVWRIKQRSERRNRMSSLHQIPGGGTLVAVKGRPNEVLVRCSAILRDGRIEPLSDSDRNVIRAQNEGMAGKALRVLGIAFREWEQEESSDDHELVWAGLIGMEDPLRPGAEDLIAQFHQAGLRTIMITGDQSATAQAIGRRLNLSGGPHLEMLDSLRIEELAPEVLRGLANNVQVFSRVNPSHKLRIIRALQATGCVVAMTGDGINDGPALKAADIGIAIGSKEVARKVADIILLDDDIRSILNAIEEGRAISDDIRKAISFLLATNMTEILMCLVSLVAGMGQPLTALQLLWINLLSDIFPELALASEPPEGDVLRRHPKAPGTPIIGRDDLFRLSADASVITAGALASFAYGLSRYGRGPQANSLAFFSLVTGQLVHTWSARSQQHSIFDDLYPDGTRDGLAPNPRIPMAVGTGFALEAIAAFVPGIRRVLGATPLGPVDWVITLGGAIIPFFINEARKAARNGASRVRRENDQ